MSNKQTFHVDTYLDTVKNAPVLGTDADGKIQSVDVDLSSYLPLAGGTLTGTLYGRSFIPTAHNTYDLGSSEVRYKDLYLSGLAYLGFNNTRVPFAGTSGELTSSAEFRFVSANKTLFVGSGTVTSGNNNLSVGSNGLAGSQILAVGFGNNFYGINFNVAIVGESNAISGVQYSQVVGSVHELSSLSGSLIVGIGHQASGTGVVALGSGVSVSAGWVFGDGFRTEAEIKSTGRGSFVAGMALFDLFDNYQSGLEATAFGNFVNGLTAPCDTGVYNSIKATANGAFVSGMAGEYTSINGSRATRVSAGYLEASGVASFVRGNAYNGKKIIASGKGAFAFGTAHEANLTATAEESFAIGADFTNSTAHSIQMGFGSKVLEIQNGKAFIYSLPTSNPNVAGQLWNDGGTIKVSAG